MLLQCGVLPADKYQPELKILRTALFKPCPYTLRYFLHAVFGRILNKTLGATHKEQELIPVRIEENTLKHCTHRHEPWTGPEFLPDFS